MNSLPRWSDRADLKAAPPRRSRTEHIRRIRVANAIHLGPINFDCISNVLMLCMAYFSWWKCLLYIAIVAQTCAAAASSTLRSIKEGRLGRAESSCAQRLGSLDNYSLRPLLLLAEYDNFTSDGCATVPHGIARNDWLYHRLSGEHSQQVSLIAIYIYF